MHLKLAAHHARSDQVVHENAPQTQDNRQTGHENKVQQQSVTLIKSLCTYMH